MRSNESGFFVFQSPGMVSLALYVMITQQNVLQPVIKLHVLLITVRNLYRTSFLFHVMSSYRLVVSVCMLSLSQRP